MARFKEAPVEEIEEEEFALGGEELTARDELYEIAVVYGDADLAEKDAKKTKDAIKGPMLELMSEVVREEIPLARQVITVTNEEAEPFGYDYEKWCAKEFPEWRVVAIQPSEGQAEVTIEERDDLKKFEFVVDGKKYGRTVAMVGAEFDAAGFCTWLEVYSKDAGISEEAFEAAFNSVKEEIVVTFTLDEDAAEQVIADYPELLPIYQQHSNPGTPQVRLIPIKAVKEEV